MKRTKFDKELLFNGLTNKLIAILLLAIGIFAMFYTVSIKDSPHALLYKYIDFISSIGQLLVAFAAGSIMLEWFGYVNYTRKRMCEILLNDEVLNVLTKTRKQELKSAILHNLYMPKIPNNSNSLVDMFDKELDNLMKDYYYEEYISYIDIIIEDNKIIKTIKQSLKVKSINATECHLHRLLSIHEFSDDTKSNIVTLLELKINNKVINIGLKSETEPHDKQNNYSTRYFIDLKDKEIQPYIKFHDTLDIEIEYQTTIDLFDRVYTHQIDRPCKHYCIHFNLLTPNYDLDLFGFGFMSLGNRKRKKIVKTQSGYMLRFTDWILPGDGISATLLDKCNKE